jgi:hypothetical protein
MAAPLQDQVERVIAGLVDALTTPGGSCTLEPIPKRVVPLYPGISVAWDACCDGQLSFQIVSMIPKYSERRGASLKTPCSVDWWAVTVRVDMLRCTPTINDAGQPPTPEAITRSGMQLTSDLGQLVRAFQTRDEVYDVGQWQPIGPDGGCVGGGTTFTFRVDSEGCE